VLFWSSSFGFGFSFFSHFILPANLIMKHGIFAGLVIIKNKIKPVVIALILLKTFPFLLEKNQEDHFRSFYFSS
jgi:hypothetical protein